MNPCGLAWGDLKGCLGNSRIHPVRNLPADQQTAFLLAPPEQIVSVFLRMHPKHKGCRKDLIAKLRRSSEATPEGQIRVRMASPLGKEILRLSHANHG